MSVPTADVCLQCSDERLREEDGVVVLDENDEDGWGGWMVDDEAAGDWAVEVVVWLLEVDEWARRGWGWEVCIAIDAGNDDDIMLMLSRGEMLEIDCKKI